MTVVHVKTAPEDAAMDESVGRTLRIDYLARVEGEGAVTVRLEGERAVEVRFAIFEPPRFFEALLRGRSWREAPDITSRICGICPVAYLMTACHALEDAVGVRVDGPLRELRRLLYCGEWIQSHAMHVFLLHAPDFLGYPDAFAMAREHREWLRRGLRIKQTGNTIVSTMGGREIHPINVRVGGFYKAPEVDALRALLPELRWSREAVAETLEWIATFEVPELERDYDFLALRHPDEYPMNEGRIVSSRGLDLEPRDYEQHFREEQVPWSTALRTVGSSDRPTLSGPLARFNLNFDRLSPAVQRLARDARLSPPVRNPFRSIGVRLLEIAQAFEEAIRIVEEYVAPSRPYVEAEPRAGTGFWATEAPRGLLFHRYTLSGDGALSDANLVPPTSRNQAAIEEDLVTLAPKLAALEQDAAVRLAGRAVRNHDPCISCSTHLVRLERR